MQTAVQSLSGSWNEDGDGLSRSLPPNRLPPLRFGSPSPVGTKRNMDHMTRFRISIYHAAALLVVAVALNGSVGCAAEHTAGSASAYNTAASRARAGDTIRLTSSMTLPPDTKVPAGVTLDLGGNTVTIARRSDGTQARGLSVEGGGITVQNGTIRDAFWALYAFYPGTGFTFRNLTIRDSKAFLKLAAAKQGLTSDILIEDVEVFATNEPQTILDLGPGATSNITIRRYKSYTGGTSSNTAADAIGIEDAIGPVLIEDVLIDGARGDGIDVKNSAEVILRRCVVKNTVRNGIKLWGQGGDTIGSDAPVADMLIQDSKIYTTGITALGVAAGNVIIDGMYIETPTVAANWGRGEVPLNVIVRNSNFRRIGTSSSSLMLMDGGDSRPVIVPGKVRFENTTFYAGPATAHLQGVKPENPTPYQSVANAKAGRWASHFVNCRYEDVPDSTPVPRPGRTWT
jgi:hypothetical protein